MKLTDVAEAEAGSVRSRNAHKTVPIARDGVSTDPERDALVAAIRASQCYAAIVVHVADAEDPFEQLVDVADFIRDMILPESFSGYAIVQRATATPASSKGGSNVIILAKAIGSVPATAIRLPDDKSDSEGVAFYDDSVLIKADFIARIDELCSDAVCIAAVGGRGGGIVPLWIPMTFVPRHNV